MPTPYCTAILVFTATLSTLCGCASNHTTMDPVYFPPPPAAPRVVLLKSFNSLADVVPPKRSWTDAFRGSPVSPFVDTPAGIAYRDSHLYICDTAAGVVHDWDLATGSANRIGASSQSPLRTPVDVAVDADGTIYVADTHRAEVIAFATDGAAVGRYTPQQHENFRPVALAVHDGKLYVADIGSHRIHVFSTASGQPVRTIGQIGTGLGEFYYPMGLAVGLDGKVFVSDMMNGRIQILDRSGSPIAAISQSGNRYGDLGKPRHLAIGPDDTIFIADAEFARIHLFNRQGQLLMLIGSPEPKPGGTPLPVGLAIAESLPPRLATLVPPSFNPQYYLFVTDRIAPNPITLFAVGATR